MAAIPTLETERLTLRAPTAEDFPAIAAFYASDRSQFVGGPLNADRAWRQLAAEIGHWTLRGYGRWSVDEKDTGKTVGMIGLWNPEGWPEPEIGWDLFEGSEGKGYATEAGRAARNYAYDTLGWTTAISLVVEGNAGSAKVAERLGAKLDGTFEHQSFGTTLIYRHLSPSEALV